MRPQSRVIELCPILVGSLLQEGINAYVRLTFHVRGYASAALGNVLCREVFIQSVAARPFLHKGKVCRILDVVKQVVGDAALLSTRRLDKLGKDLGDLADAVRFCGEACDHADAVHAHAR